MKAPDVKPGESDYPNHGNHIISGFPQILSGAPIEMRVVRTYVFYFCFIIDSDFSFKSFLFCL